jgi:hypothetical protein
MNSRRPIILGLVCAVTLSACATEIVGPIDSTISADSTTTTLPTASGDIVELLEQLLETANGLGQAIVDNDTNVVAAKKNMADAILIAIEPEIRASGIDLVEDVQRIVGLITTATTRKRPADADKVLLFLPPIIESARTAVR